MSLRLFNPQRKANMKKKTPSNPLPLAEGLNLSSNAGTAQHEASQDKVEPERPSKRKARRKSTHASRPASRASRDGSESGWNRIKRRLAAKVAQMDKEKLHEVLLGYGVAVGIAASVVLVVKFMPLATLILAFFGLALALRLWGLLPLPQSF